MSLTTKVEQPAAQSTLFTNIKNYFASLGINTNFTQHAEDHHHEDLADDGSGEHSSTLF